MNASSDEAYFVNTYKNAAAAIAHELATFDQYFATSLGPDDPLRGAVVAFVTTGGKRFRPALSLVTAQAFGQDLALPHMALETFHKYLLVHDDIIDRDCVRYGRPTVHTKMEELYKGDAAGREHFGNSIAMIAGDLLEAATHKIILQSPLDPAVIQRLQSLVVDAVEEVGSGWYEQFKMDYLPLGSPHVTQARVEESIRWVTSKYTITFPMRFGYALAGRTLPMQAEEFADVAGVLFQTGDDLIGLFGDPHETGKSNCHDIIQGKKTVPVLLSYRYASSADRKLLRQLIGKQDITTTEVQEVRSIIHRSGGYQRTRQFMQAYRTKSLQLLEPLDLPAQLKRFLRGFIAFLETRDR